MTRPHSSGTASRATELASEPTIHQPKRDVGDRKSRRRGDPDPSSCGRFTTLEAIAHRLNWMPDGDRIVFLILFEVANAKTGLAELGQSRIAQSAGCCQGTVSRRIDRLLKWDVIKLVRRGSKGNRRAALFQIRPWQNWPTAMPT